MTELTTKFKIAISIATVALFAVTSGSINVNAGWNPFDTKCKFRNADSVIKYNNRGRNSDRPVYVDEITNLPTNTPTTKIGIIKSCDKNGAEMFRLSDGKSVTVSNDFSGIDMNDQISRDVSMTGRAEGMKGNPYFSTGIYGNDKPTQPSKPSPSPSPSPKLTPKPTSSPSVLPKPKPKPTPTINPKPKVVPTVTAKPKSASTTIPKQTKKPVSESKKPVARPAKKPIQPRTASKSNSTSSDYQGRKVAIGQYVFFRKSNGSTTINHYKVLDIRDGGIKIASHNDLLGGGETMIVYPSEISTRGVK
jgi:hypothetical protein